MVHDTSRRVSSSTNAKRETTAYTYDLRGNRLTETGNLASTDIADTAYTYDVDNKLVSVTKGTSATEMAYYVDGMRARYYDPALGRFLNEDSFEGQVSNPLSLNLYTYCINNPLIYIDPSGHNAEAATYWYEGMW